MIVNWSSTSKTMPLPSDFPEPENLVSWDELQKGISADAGLEDVPGFTKTAYGDREIVMEMQDSLYANSGLLSETLEIDRHVKRMTEEEDLSYVVIEKSLVQMGYQRPTIRRSFHRITGIDPIHAYLDAANYPVPPGSVPRFCYGWGESKEKTSDFFFILPWLDKYGVFKLTGMERELDSEHHLLDDAREAMAKKVKSFRDVTPDGADTLTDIFQKVASVGVLSPKGAELYQQLQAIVGIDTNIAAGRLVEAHDANEITDRDFNIMAEHLIMAAPIAEPVMTAPERIDEKEYQGFRENQEGRSFQEMKSNTLMPGQQFSSNWQDRHKVDMWGVVTESKEMFDKIVSTIQGFRIEPEWANFNVMDSPNLATDDDNHILDGSVCVGAKAQTADGHQETQIAVLMFIHNGKLQYTGKFKACNNREYALNTQGLEQCFQDLEGSTALDEQIGNGTGTDSGMPEQQMSGPGMR